MNSTLTSLCLVLILIILPELLLAQGDRDGSVQPTLIDVIKRVKEGEADAQFLLGKRYAMGDGVEKDQKRATAWFRKAADQGHPESARRVGFNYNFGLGGLERDYAQAVFWFRAAAEKGDVPAMSMLSACYEDGNGVEKDPQKAIELLTKAARLGSSYSQFELGKKYAEGDLVGSDVTKAITWLSRAAENGEFIAMIELGEIYDSKSGNFTSVANAEKAANWYQRAMDDEKPKTLYTRGTLEARLKKLRGSLVTGFENLPASKYAYTPIPFHGVYYHLTHEGKSGPWEYTSPNASRPSYVKLLPSSDEKLPHALRFIHHSPENPEKMVITGNINFQLFKMDKELVMFIQKPSGRYRAARFIESDNGFFVDPVNDDVISLDSASPSEIFEFFRSPILHRKIFDKSEVAELRRITKP